MNQHILLFKYYYNDNKINSFKSLIEYHFDKALKQFIQLNLIRYVSQAHNQK